MVDPLNGEPGEAASRLVAQRTDIDGDHAIVYQTMQLLRTSCASKFVVAHESRPGNVGSNRDIACAVTPDILCRDELLP